MTKSELKEIIKECIIEMNTNFVEESVDINSVNEDSYVIESDEYDAYCIAEARAYLEALEEADMDESINEAENAVKNIGIFHKALKEAKANVREAKKLIKEGNTKEAKKKIDDTISSLKDAKKGIYEGNTATNRVINSALYSFVPFVDLAVEIYGNIMTHDKSMEAKFKNTLYVSNGINHKLVDKAAKKTNVAYLVTNNGFRDIIHAWGSAEGVAKFTKYIGKIRFVFDALSIAGVVAAIIKLYKDLKQIEKSKAEGNDGGAVEAKLGALIDNYIKMLEKLKSNLK